MHSVHAAWHIRNTRICTNITLGVDEKWKAKAKNRKLTKHKNIQPVTCKQNIHNCFPECSDLGLRKPIYLRMSLELLK